MSSDVNSGDSRRPSKKGKSSNDDSKSVQQMNAPMQDFTPSPGNLNTYKLSICLYNIVATFWMV